MSCQSIERFSEILYEHIDDNAAIVNDDDFWLVLLTEVVKKEKYQMKIISPLGSNVIHYAVNVSTQNEGDLQKLVISDKSDFILIIRYHQQNANELLPFLEEERGAYSGMKLDQEIDPFGYFPLSDSETIVIFLTSKCDLLSNNIDRFRNKYDEKLLKGFDQIIEDVIFGHNSNIYGFSFDPGSILIQEKSEINQLLPICFVGGKSCQPLRSNWSRGYVPKSLQSSVRKKGKPVIAIPPPSKFTDVYGLTKLIIHFFPESESYLREYIFEESSNKTLSEMHDKFNEFRTRIKVQSCQVLSSVNSETFDSLTSSSVNSETRNTLTPFSISSKTVDPLRPSSASSKTVDSLTSSSVKCNKVTRSRTNMPTRFFNWDQKDSNEKQHPLIFKTPSQPKLWEKIQSISKKISNKTHIPTIFKIPQQLLGSNSNLRSVLVGPESYFIKDEIRILVLGETGSGKTTFINGIANFLYGVDWSDSCRFKVISEEDEGTKPGLLKSQSISQTSNITSYKFAWQESFPEEVPLSVVIVDTPGFGDTRGIEYDIKTVNELDLLFRSQGTCSLDSLHAVAFVAQSSNARLTVSQKYIFDSILKIFGKDLLDNIIIIATFADAGKIKVIEAFNAAKIPTKYNSKFNNSALFADNNDSDSAINSLFWNIGVESYSKFFKIINSLEPKSLTLTKEVLTERKKLQTTIDGLHNNVRLLISQIDQIEQDKKLIEQHSRDINANKNFKYQQKSLDIQKIDLKPGEYVTNCLICNFTCHYPCYIPENQNKFDCSAMNNKYCTVCPGKCFWNNHYNNSFRFEIIEKTEELELNDLKIKYQDASSKKINSEQMLQKAEEQYNQYDKQIKDLLKTIQTCINHLRIIAARDNPLSEIEYLELQIDAEKNSKKPQWQQRVKKYQDMIHKAKLLQKASSQSNPNRINLKELSQIISDSKNKT
jgi:hypothetical protein